MIREVSRDELITEKIINAINSLPSCIDTPPPHLMQLKSKKEYLLAFGDCHYDVDFEVKGLSGEIINKYNTEIFQERMWKLYDEILEKIITNNITYLHIWELGDAIQGLLRVNSQLMQMRYGVIESSVQYAFFLSEWLNKLSHHVRINFQMVKDSNHNQLRLLNMPKNAFPDENMSKVIMVILKERLKNNPNIIFTENPTGMNYSMIAGYKVLGIHGEVKNLAKALDSFSRIYKTPVDFLIGAHVHHFENTEVGIDSEVISIRSVIGVDPYSMSIQKAANAGASLIEFEEQKGITADYRIKLN